MNSEVIKKSSFPVWETVEVRWSDMDAMGHVNNAKYFTYLESARIHFFDALELQLLRDNQQGMGLVSTACNFRKQVRYPATLEIGTCVTHVGLRSFHLAHGFFLKETGELVADAHSVVVIVDYAQEKALPLPPALKARLERLKTPEGPAA